MLLGYSGGPDSKALLYALLECGVKPHLAHVDHGWREESSREAQLLKEEAERLGCPFFSTRLQECTSEEAARSARLSYFSTLMAPYAALLFAHQAEDLAETVLKRIFEGAHLTRLGGMEPVSVQFGMAIWRPLLKALKRELIEFLKSRSLSFFEDPTNANPAYLRSRMRLSLFPFLQEQFGKDMVGNLGLLSERAFELHRFLDRRVASARIERGPWGVFADLNGLEPIEQRHLLQRLAREESIGWNRMELEILLKWVQEGAQSKKIERKQKKIWVDKGRILLFSFSSKGSISSF